MKKSVGETVQLQREVPVRYGADVAVLGGGIAGVSAACAAAASGAEVLLTEAEIAARRRMMEVLDYYPAFLTKQRQQFT